MEKIAVDIGGTKTEVCVFSSDYVPLRSWKFKTKELNPGGLDFVYTIRNLLVKFLPKEVDQIGVAWNCSVDRGKIIYSSLLGGKNFNIKDDFEKLFKVPVSVENDVNSMALAENKFGLGEEAKSFILMNLGTGLRFSFVNAGQLIRGYQGNLGEISQLEMPSNFKKENVIPMDYYLSGKGVTKIYQNLAGGIKTAQDVFFSPEDDLISIEANRIFRSRFVHVLKMISYFYNPELVILNGSLKEAKDKYIKKVLSRYYRETMPFFHFRDMKISKLDHAACLGSLLAEK